MEGVYILGKNEKQKDLEYIQREKGRQSEMYKIENQLLKTGYEIIAGIDEAGRGPLAGPVLAAAAVVPPELFIEGLNDSKKLSPKKREKIYQHMLELKIPYGLGQASVEEIDQINILNASRLAMKRAVKNLPVMPDYLLIDGNSWSGISIPHQGVVGGDARSLSIAAASIFAKVTRDRIMVKLDKLFPGYGLAKHKGYPTVEHFAALAQLGPSNIHRRSFNLHTQWNLEFKEEESKETS